MEWWQAVLLGIVQGLTEFLPVSSSGHLVVSQWLFGVEVHDLEFDLAVHLGTLLAVITVYRSELTSIAKDSTQSIVTRKHSNGLRIVLLVITASIPTAAIGFSFQDQFEAIFLNKTVVGFCSC